jgi:transport and Golgi organization protein 2
MCTITLVPHDGGFRMVSNRDERRERASARPPRWRSLGERYALFPVDPASGGTWIGVNDAGLAIAVLNGTLAWLRPVTHPISRGVLVPTLLRSASVEAALETVRGVDVSRFDPFSLVIVQDVRAVVATHEGSSVAISTMSTAVPRLLTSSSIDGAAVGAARRRLFEQMVLAGEGGWPERQRRFHRHRWPDRPEASVWMTRADARTVSRTVVDVTASAIRMSYEPVDEWSLSPASFYGYRRNTPGIVLRGSERTV